MSSVDCLQSYTYLVIAPALQRVSEQVILFRKLSMPMSVDSLIGQIVFDR